MGARTLPTMPTWTAGQEITSTLLNQITTYTQFWANPPMFRMYQSVAQTSIASGTDTQITCDTLEYDSDSGRQSISPYAYVIPFAGRWRFTGNVVWAASATSSRKAAIWQNGSQAPGTYNNVEASTTGGVVSNSLITGTFPCQVGDVIALYGAQYSGAALSTYATAPIYSYLEGRLESLATP